jgi:hypothetical protein
MRSFVVVVVFPVADDPMRFGQIPEPVPIQAAVTQSGIEGFNERVLRRFAWLDGWRKWSLTPVRCDQLLQLRVLSFELTQPLCI